MIPQINDFSTFWFAGGYPLAASASFDAGSAAAVLVALTTSNGYAYTPTASYGGSAMTLLAQTSTADTGETTTWLWGIVSPLAGEQTISIAASGYCAPATGIVIALSDVAAAPFGETDADIAEPALTLSVDVSVADCLLIAIGQAQFTSGVALTANNGFSLITSASEGAATNILSAFEKDAASIGTYSVTLTAPFNHVSGVLIALRGAGSNAFIVDSIPSTSSVGEPIFLYVPAFSADGISGQSTVGEPVFIYEPAFSADGIASSAAVGEPIFVSAAVFPLTLQPGESITFRVTFAPTVSGAATGALVLATSIGTRSLALSGTGAAVVDPEPTTLSRLSTLGNQFVDEDGNTVRLKTVNWHGSENAIRIMQGMWMPFLWKNYVDHIKEMGFNCIRFPFSGAATLPGKTPETTNLHTINQPDFIGVYTLDAWEKMFDYCEEVGLYVVLDHHRREEGDGADGSPIRGSYTQADWLASWGRMANRFKDHPAIVGADVHNEPHDLTWSEWAPLAEACGNYIHTIAPDWIIFVEGVGGSGEDSYWWGGQLKGVRDRPIVLTVPNKLAYSPHEYGQSINPQTWLKRGDYTPANWPNNLYSVWTEFWGYIFEENIAPIWIGEYGGHFGYDAASGAETKPYATEEREWVSNLLIYLNGDFDGSGTSNLTGTQKGMSCAFWTLTYNSGDTGGLLLDDFVTEQTGKLSLLAPLLED